ncbi:MAG: DUF3108 domain-containing protein [Saprospiraceae bacterium]|nr:DUF3108 domain-containing protein [Saprospiraceae bacterium]MBP7699499.1 DUF3108 domain-containing protein [Saprospiraceae bacterium]
MINSIVKNFLENSRHYSWSLCLAGLMVASDLTTHQPAIEQPIQNVVNAEPCSINNSAFQDGEQIVYKIYYNWNFVWLPAGEVTFNVADEGNLYHLSARGRTYPSYEWFFKVRDNYDTYIDKTTLLPVKSVREVHEGNYHLYDYVIFDQEKQMATSWRGDSKDKTKRTDYTLSSNCMHDMLSVIYYTRNLNFEEYKKGTKIPVKVFLDKEVYPLGVSYKGKDATKKIRDHSGSFRTIKLSPQLVAGTVFKEGDEMSLWASDDDNHLPLMIESPVSVGSVKVVLKNYKGLKYDFKAKN